jgi:para-nitrobenzyl esterase
MRVLIWAAAIAAVAVMSVSAAGAATVHTDKGDVSGVTVGQVESFKGVPFAAPPVGDLRWRPPQPAASWSGVRNGGAYGPICEQSQRASFGAPMSEDCLTLNVWRPAGAHAGQRLPVMVWIYGGAFVIGAGSTPFYDGAHFAEQGVILVTFNYRLGRFGFFAHPALDHGPGPIANYGLMDQIAALAWVKRNIAAFGGDPGNVTMFGESAGAISVNYLMGSPAAKGLFARAISESGFGRSTPRPLIGEHSAEALGVSFAGANHVAGDDTPATAAALRALSVDVLNAAPGGAGDPGQPSPILDGKIVTESIADAFGKGHEAHVPYLEGGNSYEASLFPAVAAAADAVIARAGDPGKVIAVYGGQAPPEVARELTTDALITEPDRLLARDMAAQGLPAYVYHFSYVPAAARAASFGAAHGAEVGYVFQNLPDHPIRLGAYTIPAATSDDQKVETEMHAYWVQFAKSGDPGTAGGPAWPRYNAADDELLEFGADGVAVRPHFDAARLDLIEQAAAKALVVR